MYRSNFEKNLVNFGLVKQMDLEFYNVDIGVMVSVLVEVWVEREWFRKTVGTFYEKYLMVLNLIYEEWK